MAGKGSEVGRSFEELKEIITGLCGDKKENYPLDELAASICNYYNSEKLDNIVDGWRKLLKDDSERLLLLEEAVNLHNSGCYYGATSIMMCQVDGLICDISIALIILAMLFRIFVNSFWKAVKALFSADSNFCRSVYFCTSRFICLGDLVSFLSAWITASSNISLRICLTPQ
mgnify:CR=1 FL=1